MSEVILVDLAEKWTRIRLLGEGGDRVKVNCAMNTRHKKNHWSGQLIWLDTFALCRILSQLDRSTLRLLSENQRVQDFSPKLHQEMKAAFDAVGDSNVRRLSSHRNVTTLVQAKVV